MLTGTLKKLKWMSIRDRHQLWLRMLLAASLFVGTSQAAEPLKVKGFYIGMSKAEASKVIRKDWPVDDNPDDVGVRYPGADSQIAARIRVNGQYREIAVLSFVRDRLKYFELKAEYFDAKGIEPTKWQAEFLKAYPSVKHGCISGSGKVCHGEGPGGEDVFVSPHSDDGMYVKAPVPVTPPKVIKPKFD